MHFMFREQNVTAAEYTLNLPKRYLQVVTCAPITPTCEGRKSKGAGPGLLKALCKKVPTRNSFCLKYEHLMQDSGLYQAHRRVLFNS